jgi:hypothetical protein
MIAISFGLFPMSIVASAATSGGCSPAGSTGLTALVVVSHSNKEVRGGNYVATGCDVGIYVGPNVKNVLITNVKVTSANDKGIFVQDSSNVVIKNSVVEGNGVHPSKGIAENKAIQLTGTTNSVVEDNTVIHNSADGGIAITDDSISIDPGAPNPGTNHEALGNVIKDNLVKDNKAGCGLGVFAFGPGGEDNTLLNNVVIGSAPGTGPYVGQILIATDLPSTSLRNTYIIGNTVDGSILPGIVIHANAKGDLIKDTWIKDNSISKIGFYFPGFPFTTPNTPTHQTGISIVAEVSKGETTPPLVSSTFVISNVVKSNAFGVWLCNSINTDVDGLSTNAPHPIMQCASGGS